MGSAAKACWERDYVLVRPDQHVAWRGDRIPDDWDAVVDRVRGVDSPERPAEIEPFG